MLRYTLVVFIILFAGCQEKYKEEIPVKKFADIYVDILLQGNVNIQADSIYFVDQPNVDSLLRFYDLDRKRIKYTIDEYNKDVKKWKEFYQTVIAKLEELQKKGTN